MQKLTLEQMASWTLPNVTTEKLTAKQCFTFRQQLKEVVDRFDGRTNIGMIVLCNKFTGGFAGAMGRTLTRAMEIHFESDHADGARLKRRAEQWVSAHGLHGWIIAQYALNNLSVEEALLFLHEHWDCVDLFGDLRDAEVLRSVQNVMLQLRVRWAKEILES